MFSQQQKRNALKNQNKNKEIECEEVLMIILFPNQSLF